MPNTFAEVDRYLQHGVSDRYDCIFTPEITAILIHYFVHVDKLSMDEAIRKVDALETYVRRYR